MLPTGTDSTASLADAKPARKHELNLDPEYWIKRFLYPYALDPAPLRLDEESKQTPEEVIAEKKRQKLMADESIMLTTRFQFPVSQLRKPEEHLAEIQKPITLSFDDIK